MHQFVSYSLVAIAGSAVTTPAGVLIARCVDNGLHEELSESNKTLKDQNEELTKEKNKHFTVRHEEYLVANKDKQGMYTKQMNGLHNDTALCWTNVSSTIKNQSNKFLRVYSCYDYTD